MKQKKIREIIAQRIASHHRCHPDDVILAGLRPGKMWRSVIYRIGIGIEDNTPAGVVWLDREQRIYLFVRGT